MNLLKTLVILTALLLNACTSSSQPKPDWVSAADADVPGMATFGWPDRTGDRPLTRFEIDVRNALRASLESLGYVESVDSPDFLVSFEAIEHEATRRSPPVSVGIGMGSWGGNVGGSVGTSVGLGGRETHVLQQRLTVRAIETERNVEAWIGMTGVLEELPDADAIAAAVADVMRGFPARRR